MELLKLKKIKKKIKKPWHEINHLVEKGHGHELAIIIENIVDVFLADNFYVKGQIQEEAKEINFRGYMCLSWRALISRKVTKKQFVFYERWEFSLQRSNQHDVRYVI